MKRDWELVRGILLQVEAAPAGSHVTCIEADEDKTLPEVCEHVDLLKRAGCLEALIVPGVTGLPEGFVIHRLTWEGHDFIDAAKHEKEMVAVVFKAYMTS